jgi:hypothetical protein
MPPRRATHNATDEGDEMGAYSSSLDNQLSQLSKANAKMERMLGKIGTPADNSEFRDHLSAERKSATALTKALLTSLKSQQPSRGHNSLVKAFEREYRRFANLIERIDVKQKQQIVALSLHSNDPLMADEVRREEEAAGRSSSMIQSQLPQGQKRAALRAS